MSNQCCEGGGTTRLERNAQRAERAGSGLRESSTRGISLEISLQDVAETFWLSLSPDIPPNLLTRIAFNVDPRRRFTASRAHLELIGKINRSISWNGRTIDLSKRHCESCLQKPE
jgi:hypothetical protein